MPFSDFIGNAAAVARLRELIAAGRLNRAVLLSGPEGVGKTTLAVMAGLALNCAAPPAAGDFCGNCPSCRRLAPDWSDLPARTAAALEFREQTVKTRAKEEAPLVVPAHPFIEIFPPDGEFLTQAQARLVARRGQFRPDAGRFWTLILPDFDQARWMTQSVLLKTLEEPPASTAILLLARNPLELLPTIRSRTLALALAPVAEADGAALLAARRPDLSAADRALAARLAAGCPGRALSLDLAAYRREREEALALLRPAAGGGLAPVIQFAAGRLDKEKLESLAEILYSLLQDILYLRAGHSQAIRNLDSRPELTELAQRLPLRRLAEAAEETDRMLAGSRRNAQRGLALEAWALRAAGFAGA